MFQLPLSVALRDDAGFDNFSVNGNALLIDKVERSVGQKNRDGSIFFWGEERSGKTHLLQAACAKASKLDLNAVYVPLNLAKELDVQMLDGLESLDVICIDDVDAIAGQVNWEKALFELYNRVYDRQTQIIFSATKMLKDIPFKLPDLTSRLVWGFVLPLIGLTDDEKPVALQAHANVRGFDLPNNVASYLLNNYPRDMNILCDLLNELDTASLTAQRKLTVPFVKRWLGKTRSISSLSVIA